MQLPVNVTTTLYQRHNMVKVRHIIFTLMISINNNHTTMHIQVIHIIHMHHHVCFACYMLFKYMMFSAYPVHRYAVAPPNESNTAVAYYNTMDGQHQQWHHQPANAAHSMYWTAAQAATTQQQRPPYTTVQNNSNQNGVKQQHQEIYGAAV
jgi:hypothetical protein